MLDELKEMGAEIISSKPEVCEIPYLDITLVLSLMVIVASIVAMVKIISDGITFSYSSGDIAGLVVLLIICLGSFAFFINTIICPPKFETGRTLFELYIDDPESYGEIVQKYEVVDCSKFPIVTIAISPDDWLGISQQNQFS